MIWNLETCQVFPTNPIHHHFVYIDHDYIYKSYKKGENIQEGWTLFTGTMSKVRSIYQGVYSNIQMLPWKSSYLLEKYLTSFDHS